MFFLLLLRRLLTLGFFLWLSPEKIEKAVPFFRGRLSPRSDAVVVCVRTNVRLSDVTPFSFGLLLLFVDRSAVGGFVVRGRKLRSYSAVFKINAINCLKVTNTWVEWLYIRVVTMFKSHAFLDDLRGNRCRYFAARLTTLHEHSKGEFRVVVRRKSDEPSVIVFLTICLRSPRIFSGRRTEVPSGS